MSSKKQNRIVQFLWNRFLAPLEPTPIKKKKDLIMKIVFLCICGICFVGALVVGIIIGFATPDAEPIAIIPILFIGCSLPFLPKIFVKTFRAGKAGYAVGKVTTTKEYVEVSQVSSTTYRTKHYTMHNGGEVGLMIGMLVFIFTWMFYMFFGPILLTFAVYKTAKLLYEYKRDNSQISETVVQASESKEVG